MAKNKQDDERPDDAKRAPKTEADPAVPTQVPVFAPIPAAPDGNPPPVPPENPVTPDPRADNRALLTPPADAGPEPDGPVEWATDLVRELAKTGTGAGKLDKIRRAQVERFNDPKYQDLDGSDPDRHLTAAEAADVLLNDPDVGDLTKAKARSLIEYGRYVPAAVSHAHPAAMLPAPPKGKAPKNRGVGGADVESPKGKAPKNRGPGVHDVEGVDVPTVGPKAHRG